MINPNKPMCEYRISFCTVCMNRLDHLKKTLPDNIANNGEYENLQFVLLDYNSTDGLEEWVRSSMKDYIESGRLVYYKTFEPMNFHRSHSRNLAFKLAAGEILCNIDADNYTGKGFASYINMSFRGEDNIFLSALQPSRKIVKNDVLGRICVRAVDFKAVHGYDELFSGYGFEDYDIIQRLEMNGITRRLIDLPNYLKAITHGDSDRIKHEFSMKNLRIVLLRYISPSKSELLFLFNDKRYEMGTLLHNTTLHSSDPYYALQYKLPEYEFSIAESSWLKGNWTSNKNIISLRGDNNFKDVLCKTFRGYFRKNNSGTAETFYRLTKPEMIEEIILFHSELTNRIRLKENKIKSRLVANMVPWGGGIVYKNFDYEKRLIVN